MDQPVKHRYRQVLGKATGPDPDESIFEFYTFGKLYKHIGKLDQKNE